MTVHVAYPSGINLSNRYSAIVLESSLRLKYKLSKVNYSPTPWGLVRHLSS